MDSMIIFSSLFLVRSRLRVKHQTLNAIRKWVIDAQLLLLPLKDLKIRLLSRKKKEESAYIRIISLEVLSVVEIAERFLLRPRLLFGQKVDTSCEVRVVILLGALLLVVSLTIQGGRHFVFLHHLRLEIKLI